MMLLAKLEEITWYIKFSLKNQKYLIIQAIFFAFQAHFIGFLDKNWDLKYVHGNRTNDGKQFFSLRK